MATSARYTLFDDLFFESVDLLVSHGLLPAHELRAFIELEAEYARSETLRLDCCIRASSSCTSMLSASLPVPRASCASCIVSSAASASTARATAAITLSRILCCRRRICKTERSRVGASGYRLRDDHVRVDHKQHMRESRAEIRSVDLAVPCALR